MQPPGIKLDVKPLPCERQLLATLCRFDPLSGAANDTVEVNAKVHTKNTAVTFVTVIYSEPF